MLEEMCKDLDLVWCAHTTKYLSPNALEQLDLEWLLFVGTSHF